MNTWHLSRESLSAAATKSALSVAVPCVSTSAASFQVPYVSHSGFAKKMSGTAVEEQLVEPGVTDWKADFSPFAAGPLHPVRASKPKIAKSKRARTIIPPPYGALKKCRGIFRWL